MDGEKDLEPGAETPAENAETPESDPAKAPPEAEESILEAAYETAPETIAETAQEAPAAEAPAAEAPAAEDRVAELEAQVRDLDDKWRRALAEMENVRRRADIQVDQGRKYAVADFAKDVIAVADNLARALEHVPEEAKRDDETVKSLYEGVEMTAKSLTQALAKQGVVEVPAAGRRFDPKVHEAMFEIPLPDQPAGLVVQVIETGYMIADRLLRPARVGVSKGGPKPEAADATASEAPAQGGATAYDKAHDAATRPESGSQVNEEL